MPNTPNLDLHITNDDSELFKDWRDEINGATDSNATKVDAFAGKFAGGTANQYYKKKSNTKFDGEWETADSSPTFESQKLLLSGGAFTAIEDAKNAIDTGKSVIVIAAGAVEQELLPDVFYNFTGELTSLEITLAAEKSGRENEYKGQFLSGATAPTVTLPTGVSWIGGTPTIEVNKIYQFSILNGIGVMVGV